MFDTVVIATDGSESGERAVETALDLAADFESTVHALSVVGEGEDRERAEEAVAAVAGRTDAPVTTAVREGNPADEICAYGSEVGTDLVAMGTRGRGGDSFHLGSVAEAVVERSREPVLTVRQLSGLERE
jgi:nucleotide-binding universal stress UspA family protein